MQKDRALWVSLGAFALVFAAYRLRQDGGAGWMPGCFFREMTGFECPGCGMTRATHALLNGRIAEAVLLNPVGMVVLPLAFLALGLELVGWVRGKPLPFAVRTGRWGAAALAVVMTGWWVFRNVV